MSPDHLEQQIENLLTCPIYFRDVLDALPGVSYRSVLQAWSAIRSRRPLDRDEHGRYVLASR